MNEQDVSSMSHNQKDEPVQFISDTRLSNGEVALMVHLQTRGALRKGAPPVLLQDLVRLLGTDAERIESWAKHLQELGYIPAWLIQKESGRERLEAATFSRQPARRSATELYEIGGGPDPALRGRIEQLLNSLEWPENLKAYHRDIFVALESRPDLATPENSDIIQRVFWHLSASIDAGSVDTRGPAGLLIYMIRQRVGVPPLRTRRAE